MKKPIAKLIIVVTTAFILSAGCARDISSEPSKNSELSPSNQTAEISSVSESSSQEKELSVSDNTDDWQMEEEYQKIETTFSDSMESLHTLGITNSHILLSAAKEKAQRICAIMDYDLKNKTWREIGNYNNWDAELADWIQMGAKTYFAYNDFFEDQYRMICINTDNQEVTHPTTFDYYSPKASYEAMDDKNFFLYLFHSEFSEETQYHFYLYNTEENNCEEIYIENYSDTSHIIIEDISAQDQLLYIFCKAFEGEGKCAYKIIVCNSDGEQLKEIILDDLTERLLEDERHERYDYIKGFTVLGDCFFFKLAGSQYLYTYEDGFLHLLELPAQHLMLDEQRGDNLRDREENPYYYFWDAQSNTLYPFNCRTKTFTKLPFIREYDENVSINIWDDAEGNLLMSYFYKPWGGEAVPEYYYIPQSTILKYMA